MDENISTILYIIIGIVYFLYSILKKSKKQQPPNQDGGSPIPGNYEDLGENQGERPESTQRRPSFDDLLKEFTQEFEEKKAAKEPVVEEYEEEYSYEPYTNYEDPTPTPTTNKYQDYLNSKQEEVEKALTQRIFKEPEEEVKVSSQGIANDIRKMLQDPEGIRKAIVVNEILKRKYF